MASCDRGAPSQHHERGAARAGGAARAWPARALLQIGSSTESLQGIDGGWKMLTSAEDCAPPLDPGRPKGLNALLMSGNEGRRLMALPRQAVAGPLAVLQTLRPAVVDPRTPHRIRVKDGGGGRHMLPAPLLLGAIRSPRHAEALKALEQSVRETVSARLGDLPPPRCCDWAFLHTEPDSGGQKLHYDAAPCHVRRWLRACLETGRDIPFQASVFVPLDERGRTLLVAPGTAWAPGEGERLPDGARSSGAARASPVAVHVPFGSFLLFSGVLVHAGAPGDGEDNVCLHCYTVVEGAERDRPWWACPNAVRRATARSTVPAFADERG
jgi:hypothetical protein